MDGTVFVDGDAVLLTAETTQRITLPTDADVRCGNSATRQSRRSAVDTTNATVDGVAYVLPDEVIVRVVSTGLRPITE